MLKNYNDLQQDLVNRTPFLGVPHIPTASLPFPIPATHLPQPAGGGPVGEGEQVPGTVGRDHQEERRGGTAVVVDPQEGGEGADSTGGAGVDAPIPPPASNGSSGSSAATSTATYLSSGEGSSVDP